MQLDFIVNDIKSFSTWLKRFSIINKSLQLEVDTTTSEFIAKTYNDEFSVIKYSKISFVDIGFELTTKKLPSERLRVGLFDIQKIIKTAGQYTEAFKFIIKYENVENDDGSIQLTGKQVLLKSDDMKIGFDCTSLGIFPKYITDSDFTNIVCKIDTVITFPLNEIEHKKILNLSDLDKDYNRIKFKAENSKISIRSNSFELILGKCNGESVSLPILKEQFEKIDAEKHTVQLSSERVVLNSLDSNTSIALGGLDMNEYDADKEIEL